MRREHAGSEQRLGAESIVLSESRADRFEDDPRHEEVQPRLEEQLPQLDARAVVETTQEPHAASRGSELGERATCDRARGREYLLGREARKQLLARFPGSAQALLEASSRECDGADSDADDGQALHREGECHHDRSRVVELDAAVALDVRLVQPPPAERVDHLQREVQARVELGWRPLPEEEGAGEEEHERERKHQDRPARPRPDREARASQEHDRRQREHEPWPPAVHEGERTDVLARSASVCACWKSIVSPRWMQSSTTKVTSAAVNFPHTYSPGVRGVE